MKPWLLASLGIALFGHLVSQGQNQKPNEQPWVVIIGGNTHGYLAPCGCVKPMSGGIKRKADAIEQLSKGTQPIILENGGLVHGVDRQSQIKAETLGESYALMGIHAVNLNESDFILGSPTIAQIHRLSQDKLFTSVAQPGFEYLPHWKTVGPFLIGGLPGKTGDISEFLSEAKVFESVPILMIGGGLDDAKKIAAENPSLKLIIYQENSQIRQELVLEKGVPLVSPGEKGKALARLVWNGHSFEGYEAVDLGEKFTSTKRLDSLYSRYQKRVKEEKLLDKQPRTEDQYYVGSNACFTCHQTESEVWKNSAHAHALSTLEKVGHDYDPECVGCHVIGLKSKHGFMSRTKTPEFADVGCESCHGSGKNHSKNPSQFPFEQVKEDTCISCHNPDHSPGFDFKEKWKKIKH